MILTRLRRVSVAAIVVALVLAVPSYAKRRSVGVRSAPNPFTTTISGVIVDNVTGQPVYAVDVVAGNREDFTDKQGKFDLKNVTGYGYLELTASRSGYQTSTLRINPTDPTQVTIRLNPTPTVLVRLANGQTTNLDYESLKFGYPVPFSGYRDAEFDDFCKTTDSTQVRIDKSQMRRLAGPATLTTGAGCCESGNAYRMSLTLKTGETLDVIFTDTCQERYKVDIGAREHVTGEFVHLLITDIVEIVFP